MEIQMTLDEPRYWAVLKLEALDNIPSLFLSCLRRRGQCFSVHQGLWDLWPPSPAAIFPPLALLPLAGISRRGKQTNYKETNITAKWESRENTLKGEEKGIIFSFCAFFFSPCPAVPTVCVRRQRGPQRRSSLSMGSARQMGGWWIDLTW